MSKAFTKEDSGDQEDDDLEGQSPLPQGTKNYITPMGADRLKNELQDLLKVQRPEVVRTVSWAASNGDRSENGDYIYGKKRLREIDRRIRFLSKRLDAAEIVDPALQSGDRILFGATVTVETESGEKRRFQIVGIDETDPSQGKISWISPIARALLQSRKGETVSVITPRGEEEFLIIDVRFS
jgi:transcription elongation factor GreB